MLQHFCHSFLLLMQILHAKKIMAAPPFSMSVQGLGSIARMQKPVVINKGKLCLLLMAQRSWHGDGLNSMPRHMAALCMVALLMARKRGFYPLRRDDSRRQTTCLYHVHIDVQKNHDFKRREYLHVTTIVD